RLLDRRTDSPLARKAKSPAVTFDNVARLCYEFAVKVEWEGKVHEVEKRVTVERLLDMFRLSREAHLVSANGTLVTEDHMLEPDDHVRIIRVISGG
ncbi:MAG TPA: MoaD/ThiS family protein, partial [Syntrophorhabdales bacterium]|nr:MoaD/ThiS family protein [Syntrophorhabdales bacterium]